MEKNLLIANELMDCPLCGDVHELQLWNQNSQAVVKNEVIEYREFVYRCRCYSVKEDLTIKYL